MGHSQGRQLRDNSNEYNVLLLCYMLGFPPYNTGQPPQYMSQRKGENKEENDTGKLIEKKLKYER